MKKIKGLIFLAVAALCSLTAHAADEPDRNDSISGPRLVLESKVIDFGMMKADEVREDTLSFRNSGTEPLVIHSIFSDCGCTVPAWSEAPVAPGQSGKIRVKFSSKGRLPGSFRKVIRVRSNAVNSLEVVFVEGKVARPYVK